MYGANEILENILMSIDNLREALKFNVHVSLAASYIIIALMMSSFVYTFVLLGRHLFPGWGGLYLIWMALLISLEVLFTRRTFNRAALTITERVLFYIAEWLIIFLVLAAVIWYPRYKELWELIQQILAGKSLSFMTFEILASGIVLSFVWMLSIRIAEYLVHLEGDEHLLKLEQESGVITARSEARVGIVNQVILMGAVMVFITAFIRIDLGNRPGMISMPWPGTFNSIFYFIMALVLLSLTQYSLLRIHWVLEHVFVHREISTRWLASSLLIIFLLSLLALSLPTDFTTNILSDLQLLLSYLIAALGFLLTLLSIPLIWLFGIVMSLFGSGQSQVEVPPVPQMAPPETALAGTNSWFIILRNTVFLLGLFVVSILALSLYFREQSEIISYLKKFRIVTGFTRLLAWVSSFFSRFSIVLFESVPHRFQEFFSKGAELRNIRDMRFFNIKRLSPRERVIFFYLGLVRRGAQKGIGRLPSQTPLEYSERLSKNLAAANHSGSSNREQEFVDLNANDLRSDITGLTQDFIEAKYSRHIIDDEMANQDKIYWRRILTSLRRIVRRKNLLQDDFNE